jgi:hypothetical protein
MEGISATATATSTAMLVEMTVVGVMTPVSRLTRGSRRMRILVETPGVVVGLGPRFLWLAW